MTATTTEAQLVDAIRAAPDDDEPRLVYADAIAASDPERGELIALQCAIERGGMPRDAAVAARRRVDDLLATHGARWAPLDGVVVRWTWARGFVDHATVRGDVLPVGASQLARYAPVLRRLDVRGPHRTSASPRDVAEHAERTAQVAQRVAVLLRASTVRVLGLAAFVTPNDPDPTHAALDRLGAAGVLARLSGLVLHDGPGLLAAQAHAGRVGALAELELHGAPVSGVRHLGRWFGPARLCLRDPVGGASYADVASLARGATRLAWLDGIAAMPEDARARLRGLGVGSLAEAAVELARDPAFGGLVELDVSARDRIPITSELLAGLGSARHLRPRVLRLDALLEPDAVRALAATPLGRALEVLDLRGRWSSDNARVATSAFDGIVLR
jgi:uncharacterized protein (TIGR02996 family)|nr:TIGR02996 domain-containing protein [Kofleriaceae bacterium]